MEPPFCALGYHAEGLRQAVACGLPPSADFGVSDRGERGRAAVVKIVALKAHVRARRKGMALFLSFPPRRFLSEHSSGNVCCIVKFDFGKKKLDLVYRIARFEERNRTFEENTLNMGIFVRGV